MANYSIREQTEAVVVLRLSATLAQNIDTIVVCELRRGFAFQCFHLFLFLISVLFNLFSLKIYI